jgi:hypothetical protein
MPIAMPIAMPNEHFVTVHGSDVHPRPHHVHDSRHGANGQSLLPSLFPLRRICLAVGVLSWTVVEACAHPHTHPPLTPCFGKCGDACS